MIAGALRWFLHIGRGPCYDRRVDLIALVRIAIECPLVVARRLAILAPSLVPPQSGFDADCRLICAGIGIRRKCLGLEHNPRVEMDDALGSETESIPADGNVTGKAAVEIFGHRFREARIDAPAKRFSNLDVLARDAKWHDRPPMTAGRRSRPRARALAHAHARFPRT